MAGGGPAANEIAAKRLGRSVRDVVGQSLADLMVESDYLAFGLAPSMLLT